MRATACFSMYPRYPGVPLPFIVEQELSQRAQPSRLQPRSVPEKINEPIGRLDPAVQRAPDEPHWTRPSGFVLTTDPLVQSLFIVNQFLHSPSSILRPAHRSTWLPLRRHLLSSTSLEHNAVFLKSASLSPSSVRRRSSSGMRPY